MDLTKLLADVNPQRDSGKPPEVCKECGYTEMVFVPKDYIEGQMCEAEIRCRNCNALTGYWAYGAYEPDTDK